MGEAVQSFLDESQFECDNENCDCKEAAQLSIRVKNREDGKVEVILYIKCQKCRKMSRKLFSVVELLGVYFRYERIRE